MMSTATCVWTGDRVASLARAALEAEAGSPLAADVRAGVHEVIRTVQDQQCDLLLSDLEGQFLRRAGQPPARPPPRPPRGPGRLAASRRAEDKLRTQLIENEELNLKLQKERESHKSIGDQTLSQTEQITALQGEVERLKKLSETTLRDRDVKVEVAKAEAAVAGSPPADAAFVKSEERRGGKE